MRGKLCVLIGGAFLAWLAVVPTAFGARPTGPLVPKAGALFGAFADMGEAGWHQGEVTQFERMIDRKLDIDHRFYSWDAAFPGNHEDWDAAAGRISMITWEPWGTNLDGIRSGAFDAMIRERAAGLRDAGSPVFLRFAHEMNGDWYPWAGPLNNDPGRRNGAAKYVAAWRHVHDLFAEEGASNVVWVWCPNRSSFPTVAWNDFRRYYPGDAYVDWVCIDGYNLGATEDWSFWRSFEDVFRPIYDAYAGIKPIMIGETGTVELGGDKAQWIRDVHAAVQSSFPSIAAFLWFNIDKNGHNWRVDSSNSALNAYRAMAEDAYFNVSQTLADENPAAALAPVTSGGHLLGETLSGSLGDWTAPADTTIGLQWNRCDGSGASCQPIPDALYDAYLISRADLGHTLRLVVTVTDASGAAVSVATEPTQLVAGAIQIAEMTVLPRQPVRFAKIRFILNLRAAVSVKILNNRGQVIRHRKRHRVYRPGLVRVRWGGRSDSGASVRRGRRYRVLVVARPLAKSVSSVQSDRTNVSFVLGPPPAS